MENALEVTFEDETKEAPIRVRIGSSTYLGHFFDGHSHHGALVAALRIHWDGVWMTVGNYSLPEAIHILMTREVKLW